MMRIVNANPHTSREGQLRFDEMGKGMLRPSVPSDSEIAAAQHGAHLGGGELCSLIHSSGAEKANHIVEVSSPVSALAGFRQADSSGAIHGIPLHNAPRLQREGWTVVPDSIVQPITDAGRVSPRGTTEVRVGDREPSPPPGDRGPSPSGSNSRLTGLD